MRDVAYDAFVEAALRAGLHKGRFLAIDEVTNSVAEFLLGRYDWIAMWADQSGTMVEGVP